LCKNKVKWDTKSKKYFIPYRAKVLWQADQLYFADLQDVIYGVVVKKTGHKRYVPFVILILEALTG
jgi:hypothetical protein